VNLLGSFRSFKLSWVLSRLYFDSIAIDLFESET
jgi:hypothetical protein